MKKKGVWGWGLFGLALVIATVLVFRLGRQSLIRKATRVATFDAVLDTHCLWISDHAGIYLRYRRDDSGFELARLDIETGRVTSMEALNRKYSTMMQWPGPHGKSFNSQGERQFHWMPLHDASPDGKWLVFSTPTIRKHDQTYPGSYIAIILDGAQEACWQAGTFYARNPLWLQDGHRWLEPIYEYKRVRVLHALIVHDVDRPQEDRTLPMVGAARAMGIFGVTATDQLAVTEWSNPGMGLPSLERSAPSYAEYLTYNVPNLSDGNSPGRLSRYRVRMPEGFGGSDSVLSPQGDRIAWHVRTHHVTWLDHLVHRFVPTVPLRFEEREGIWVSKLDGSGMTEIGYNVVSGKTHDPYLYQMQWLPGGKKISFISGSGIYTVPAR